MSNKTKRDSPLVQCVLALDVYLSELERLGTKINSTDMTSDVDVEYVQKLITRFAECGEGISKEVATLATQLQEAQQRAQRVTQGVATQAELFNKRRSEQNEKLERFRVLSEKIGQLNASIGEFRRPHAEAFTPEDRAKLTSNIPALENQLTLLIEELQDLQKSARDSRMKALDKQAGSLTQSLEAVRKKLHDLIK